MKKAKEMKKSKKRITKNGGKSDGKEKEEEEDGTLSRLHISDRKVSSLYTTKRQGKRKSPKEASSSTCDKEIDKRMRHTTLSS